VLLGVGALVLLANPRHRAFYFGQAAGVARPFRLPPASFDGEPARAPVPASVRGRKIPTADADGRVRVPLADVLPWRLPADGVPEGWEVQEFEGQAHVGLLRSDGRLALRLRSEKTSFALYRDVVLDVREFPILAWSWRVLRLPAGGDVRDPGRDDQAAQVYVVFPRWPAPRASSDVIGYVWDTRAPVGTRLPHPKAPNVRLIVVESGARHLDVWQEQRRNVAEDYAALFGRRPPRMGKLAVMIDSNDTGGSAEALLGEISFSRAPSAQRLETPTSMLR